VTQRNDFFTFGYYTGYQSASDRAAHQARVIGSQGEDNVKVVSVLVGFLTFAMAGPGPVAPAFSKAGTHSAASAHSVKARWECRGLNHEGVDAVYYNCTTHPAKIEISHYFGMGSTIACVPAHGQYHSAWWNTKNQTKIADNCG
jgi:hypothetical protein